MFNVLKNNVNVAYFDTESRVMNLQFDISKVSVTSCFEEEWLKGICDIVWLEYKDKFRQCESNICRFRVYESNQHSVKVA